MRYKVYIDVTGGGYTEVSVDNIEPFAIEREEISSSTAIKQFFYRLKWGKLQLRNKPFIGLNIFDLIDSLDYDFKILVKFQSDIKTIFGYFGKNDCNYDLDRRILTVTPATIDAYTSLLENWENEIDFANIELDNSPLGIKIDNAYLKTIGDWPFGGPGWPGNTSGLYETPRNRVKDEDYVDNGGLPLYFDGQKPKETLFADPYWGFNGFHLVYSDINKPISSYNLQQRVNILGQTPSSDSGDANYGPTLYIGYGDFELSKFRIYEGTRTGGLSGKRWRNLYCETWFSRDEYTKVDVVDEDNEWGYEPPEGDGWSMRMATIKNGSPAHIWTRKPFNGAFSESWTLDQEVLNNSSASYLWNWNKYLESEIKYTTNNNIKTIVSSIGLRDFIEHLIHSSDTSLSGMQFKSTFIFNDNEADFDILKYSSGYNYVTGSRNVLNNIRLFFTKDLIPEDTDKKKKSPKYSLKEILDSISKSFCGTIGFYIDDNGHFRIEHDRVLDLIKKPVDVSSSSLLSYTSQWEFDKAAMFERFEYSQSNAAYPDFVDNVVSFNKIISNNRNKDLKSISDNSIITTDLKYCMLNPLDLNEGIVMVAADANNAVMDRVCYLSGLSEPNGHLAISSVLDDYGRYEGVWLVGKINNFQKEFTTTKRTKLGIELSLKGNIESMFYITQFGIGLIDNGSIDFTNETTKIKLRYRYNAEVDTDTFVLVFQKSTDFVGALNIWADIDNYLI